MKVVLIEDDPEVQEVVSIAFETAWPGSQVAGAQSGAEGLELVRREIPDILILDVALPEGDNYGYEICKEVRSFSEVPIIMLTGRSREVDVARGLELGAADYVSKPFSSLELLARTRAVLRRSQMGSLGTDSVPFVSKNLAVDFDTGEVIVLGEPVKLTPTEYKLLAYLIENRHRVLSHRTILTDVWGEDQPVNNNLVKTHIQRLRKKLRDDPQNPQLIITERGSGYRFASPS